MWRLAEPRPRACQAVRLCQLCPARRDDVISNLRRLAVAAKRASVHSARPRRPEAQPRVRVPSKRPVRLPQTATLGAGKVNVLLGQDLDSLICSVSLAGKLNSLSLWRRFTFFTCT